MREFLLQCPSVAFSDSTGLTSDAVFSAYKSLILDFASQYTSSSTLERYAERLTTLTEVVDGRLMCAGFSLLLAWEVKTRPLLVDEFKAAMNGLIESEICSSLAEFKLVEVTNINCDLDLIASQWVGPAELVARQNHSDRVAALTDRAKELGFDLVGRECATECIVLPGLGITLDLPPLWRCALEHERLVKKYDLLFGQDSQKPTEGDIEWTWDDAAAFCPDGEQDQLIAMFCALQLKLRFGDGSLDERRAAYDLALSQFCDTVTKRPDLLSPSFFQNYCTLTQPSSPLSSLSTAQSVDDSTPGMSRAS